MQAMYEPAVASEPCCVLKEIAHIQVEMLALLVQTHDITTREISFSLCIGRNSLFPSLVRKQTPQMYVSNN